MLPSMYIRVLSWLSIVRIRYVHMYRILLHVLI